MARHYRRDNTTNKPTELSMLQFYTTTLDLLHFYLLHLFDVGLLINVKQMEEKCGLNPEEKRDIHFDSVFSRYIERSTPVLSIS